MASASPWTWLGAGLLGVSLWILDHELIVAVAQLREVDFSQLLPRLEGYATALRQVPLPLLLLGTFDSAWGHVAHVLGWAFAWWALALYWYAAWLYLRQIRDWEVVPA